MKSISTKQIICAFVTLALFSSCADGGNRRLRPSDVQGTDGLESSEYTAFVEIINQEQAKTIFPTENTEYHAQVTYAQEQKHSFQIEIESKKYNCQYAYTKATQEFIFNKQVETNDDGQEIIVYTQQKTEIPIEPRYTTIPQIDEVKMACDDQITRLNKVDPATIIDFENKWSEFKTLMTQQYVDLLQRCNRGARANGAKCIGATFSKSIFSEGNPVDTFAFTIDFTWLSDEGVESTVSNQIQVSPQLYYFENFGILHLDPKLPISNSDIAFAFLKIESLKLSGL